MQTERALIDVTVGMRIPCIIRAGGDTGPAADAFVVGNRNNTPFLIMTGTGRAAPDARRIFTMVASLGAEFKYKRRIRSIGHLHHPIAAKTDRNIVLGLTGNDAIAAPDAFPGINCHSISHDLTSPASVTKVTKLPLMPVPPMVGSTNTLVIIWVSLAPLPKHRCSFF